MNSLDKKEKNIYVQYFAYFRECADKEMEILRGTWETPKEVYTYLKKKYNWLDPKGKLDDTIRIAVNDSFVSWDYTLLSEDKVVFVTQVSGG